MSTVDGDLISSLYPPPPVYYKFFTNENLLKLKTWKELKDQTSFVESETKTSKDQPIQDSGNKDASENKEEPQDPEGLSKEAEAEAENHPSNETNKSEQIPEVPGELKFLVPPKQPEGTHYRGYGNLWAFEDKLPTLKSTNWEQLYKDDDELITSETKIKELHKLMDSLLLNFLELVGIVSIDPQRFEQKVKDISLLLININHLLNTYRPHQSRESLIMLLRKQIEAKQQEITQIDQVSESVKSKILKLTDSIDGLETNDMHIEEKNQESSIEIRKQEIIQSLVSKNL